MVTKNSGYLIQSNFGQKGNFEVVINTREGLRHLFRDNDDPNLPWIRGPFIAGIISSRPALIQSNYGTKGNFEVVVTRQNGKLAHWVRNNDDPNLPWYFVGEFASGVRGAPALIQSNYGTKGNFEVVVNTNDGLQHWSRNNDDPNRPWHHAGNFASEATGEPALIQSNYGTKGNFEVVVNTNDGLQHWSRNNDDPNLPWIRGSTFTEGGQQGPALIQSNYGTKGNFEVITDGRHIYRNNDDPNLPWVWGKHFQALNGYEGAALIQSNFGQKGNFEAIVQFKALTPERDPPPPYNVLTHHFRNNDDPDLPWIEAPSLPVITAA
jgi:predicted Rdx family selenoprotein